MKTKLASAAFAVAGLTALAAPAANAVSAPPPAPPNSATAHVSITIGSPTTCTPINLGILGITICL